MKTYQQFIIPVLCTIMLLGAAILQTAQAQTFSVTPKQMSMSGNPGDFLDTFADVENLTQASASLRIQLLNPTLPAGWSASFCMVNCYAPDAVDVTETFEPGQKVSFHLTWITSANEEQVSLTYKLTNMANTSETYTVTFSASTKKQTGIPGSDQLLKTPVLKQNYPNPFSISKSNTELTIDYTTVKPGFVTLKVYNLIGREIATIVSDVKPAGVHRVSWNAMDYQKNTIPPGIYIYKLVTGGNSLSRRLLVTR